MPNIDGTSTEGLTRREALKRGAAFGGALLWATPVVQAIGMSRAIATETSGNCRTYCIKYEFTGGDDDLQGYWTGLGRTGRDEDGDPDEAHRGRCLVCPPGIKYDSFPASFFEGFQVYGGDRKDQVSIRYPKTCSLVETDSSPDPFYAGSAVAAKCGSGPGSCAYQDPVETVVGDFIQISVDGCANGAAISHIEMIIRCCLA